MKLRGHFFTLKKKFSLNSFLKNNFNKFFWLAQPWVKANYISLQLRKPFAFNIQSALVANVSQNGEESYTQLFIKAL